MRRLVLALLAVLAFAPMAAARTTSSIEVTGLKVAYGTGQASLSWSVTSTTNLLQFLIEERQGAGAWVKLAYLPATARSATLKEPAGALTLRVWAVPKVGSKESTGTVAGEPPPEEEPPVEEPPPPPPGSCFDAPGFCGYPTPATTGVEAGHTLTNITGTVHPAAGEVRHDQRITGSVAISAANVTLENVEVVPPDNACTPAANESVECGNNYVPIDINAPGARLLHVKVACAKGAYQQEGKRCAHAITSGPGALSGPPLLRWVNYENAAVKLYSGGTLEDSFCDMEHMNGVPPKQQHYECFSDQATKEGGAPIVIRHNTLLNPHDQTAVIFLQSLFGPLGDELVEGNLVAGGGYLIYHEAREGHPVGTLTIKGNRVARACKGQVKLIEGHHYCPAQSKGTEPTKPGYEQAIPQSLEGGYFPQGGSYGTLDNNGTVTQSGNVWDDTGAAVTF